DVLSDRLVVYAVLRDRRLGAGQIDRLLGELLGRLAGVELALEEHVAVLRDVVVAVGEQVDAVRRRHQVVQRLEVVVVTERGVGRHDEVAESAAAVGRAIARRTARDDDLRGADHRVDAAGRRGRRTVQRPERARVWVVPRKGGALGRTGEVVRVRLLGEVALAGHHRFLLLVAAGERDVAAVRRVAGHEAEVVVRAVPALRRRGVDAGL